MSPATRTKEQIKGNGVPPSPVLSNNQILSRLPRAELSALMERVEDISVELRDGFFEEGVEIGHVYFPLTGMASLVTVLDDGTMVEAMTIGREGFLGLTVVHGAKVSGLMSMCQIEGRFLRISSREFLDVLDDAPDLRRRLLLYSEFAQQVLAQWSACNSVHLIEQRCARWLLVTSDAVGSSTFDLTQEFLSQMLSVRRPGVTAAMGGLERRGLVGHRYGKVAILDEAGLKDVSCECYGSMRAKAAILLV